MRETELLQQALGLTPPWRVTGSSFDPISKRLDIKLDFPRGSRFSCPECHASDCPAHDTEEKSWRHLNFFQHEAYLHARVPRVRCETCGVKRLSVPWARDGSGFTLLFELLVMNLVRAMPVAAVAREIGEHDTRIWRIVHHYVDDARDQADYSTVTRVAFDETASRRGHNYVTLFVDLDRGGVLFATEGKDADTVAAFRNDLLEHGGDPDKVTEVCIDMSSAFISGATKSLPAAQITFDKFHAVKIVNDAVDQVRRAERKQRGDLLSRTRYLWLKNPAKLSAKERDQIHSLRHYNLKTARAYQIRLTFQDLYSQPDRASAEAFLKKWYFWATHSRLPPMIDAAKSIKRHWDGVLRWFDTKIANGLLEGINSLVQAAKAKARGYRSNRNLCAMIYLIAGKLEFQLPT